MSDDQNLTRALQRLGRLLGALGEGPLRQPELLERLEGVYPSAASAPRMLRRDLAQLRTLGIAVESDGRRPPTYTLEGGAPRFSEAELGVLALVRDSFGARHPQAPQVQALLERLTRGLDPQARRRYERRAALGAALEPAIDYTPHQALLERLASAISQRRALSFRYQPLGRPAPTLHRRVEPDEIEPRDRHYYLVAYTYNSRKFLEFRVDRIIHDATFQELQSIPPGAGHTRPLISFRYRLDASLAQGELSRRFAHQDLAERLPNGDAVVAAQDYSEFFIVRTLLRYGARAELLWPPELRAQIARETAAMHQLYSGTAGER